MPRVWAPTHWLGWLSVLLWAALRPLASLVLQNVQQVGVLSCSGMQARKAISGAGGRVTPVLAGLHRVYRAGSASLPCGDWLDQATRCPVGMGRARIMIAETARCATAGW